jgi:hypothetical protein
MKPKGQSEHDDGMLEFLEDIIGSNRFKEPIEILAKRVETLNELRGEKVRGTLAGTGSGDFYYIFFFTKYRCDFGAYITV